MTGLKNRKYFFSGCSTVVTLPKEWTDIECKDKGMNIDIVIGKGLIMIVSPTATLSDQMIDDEMESMKKWIKSVMEENKKRNGVLVKGTLGGKDVRRN
jgi:hypothetical protein